MSEELSYVFENWFSIDLPPMWNFEKDEDLINFYSNINPKGAIQVSFFKNRESIPVEEVAIKYLNKFINQQELEIVRETYKVIETSEFTIANVSGRVDDDFIKVWSIVNPDKLLLVTYISPKKSRELSQVEDIVYSINFLD